MHILIAGAGQVGRSVATELSSDHTVSVIDLNGSSLDPLPSRVEAIQGNASELEVLKQAGVEAADVLISCTSDDQTNIIICSTARTVSDALRMARVSDPSYLHTWEQSRSAFGIDWMVGRAKLTSEAILDKIGFQSRRDAAREVDYFGGGRILMAEYDVDGNSDIAGQTVQQADRYDGVTFGSVFRNGDMIVPAGDTRIHPDDRIVVIGEPTAVKAVGTRLNPSSSRQAFDNVVIAGGGFIGFQTAALLQERGLEPRLIEQDPERAQFVAEKLSQTIVLQGDATNQSLWNQERLDQADLLIVTLRPDERNLLTASMGTHQGVDLVISKVNKQEYLSLFEASDIDFCVHPREVVSEEIKRHIEERDSEKVTAIEHHQGEVYEVTIPEGGSYVGSSIEELRRVLPGRFVFGAILRGNRLIIPRGDTVLQEGDRSVLVSEADVSDDIVDALT